MSANHVLLNRTTITVSSPSIDVMNLPQSGYTDLKIVISARSDNASVIAGMSFQVGNQGIDRNSNYSYYELTGDGTSASSSSGTVSALNTITCGANSTANTFSNTEIYIYNYTESAAKTMSVLSASENNGQSAQIRVQGWKWNSTTSISAFKLNATSGNFIVGTTVSVYGIAKPNIIPAISPKATGGDIIVNDGVYWYHAFLSTGAFKPRTNINCDVLAVAGGGGGGNYYSAGGGGGGGVVGFTNQRLSVSSYTVTVGAGGASPTGANGSNGSDSQFGSFTAAVGGGGGGARPNNGLAGGSGGGGGGYSANTTGGAATSGQGYAGADGKALGFSPQDYAGGGGGAGGPGVSGVGLGYSNGGIGTDDYSTWALVTGTGDSGYYAGGGGGYCNNAAGPATGGVGGGGRGMRAQAVVYALAGTANTGGGGGGGWDTGNSAGAAGGSGIVIVRYAMA